jgi:hypothetical protein
VNPWGALQTFSLGMALGSQATPSSPVNGQLWLDSGDGRVKVRENGSTYTVRGAASIPMVSGLGAGSGSVTASSDGITPSIQYISPGYSSFNTEPTRAVVMPVAGVISRLQVRAGTNQSLSGLMTCTLRKNSSDTAVTFVIAAGETAGTKGDLTHTATYAQDDTLSLQCANYATSTSTQISWISWVFTPAQ